MEVKEKVKELIKKYDVSLDSTSSNVKKITLMNAKRHALICVDEILDTLFIIKVSIGGVGMEIVYWENVKREINLL